jgi:Tetratricopeptide repeat
VIRGEYREGEHVSPGATMAKMRPYYKLVGDPAKPVSDFAEGYDGSAWEYYQDPGIVVRTVGKAAAAARHGLAIDGPLADYRAKGSAITLRGKEKIDGRPAYCLRVRMADGFEEDEFIDAESSVWVASRKVASVHAFGREIATETRFSDYRPVDGIRFSFSSKEVEIATGKVLNEFRTTSIVVNEKLDPAVFSPPALTLTPLRKLMADLYGERTDVNAVLWTYHDFRRAHPEIETDEGMQVIGYQILKMGDHPAAVALLEANAKEHPKSSGAFFGLGRAYRERKEFAKARAQFETALKLDPNHQRARQALTELASSGP